MSDVRLIVNGNRYGGWKSIRFTRTIESIAGSFELGVSDRWGGQGEPWPIREEDVCQVEVDGESAIDGYVDRRALSIEAETRTLTYSGKDKTAVLVECSAVLSKWSFRGIGVLDLAEKVAAPFGVSVSVQSGLSLPEIGDVFAINPDDTAFSVLERAAKIAGVLLVSSGGGLVLTRAGTGRAAPLVEGANIKAASVEYDGSERFYRYIIGSQFPGTDQASAAATKSTATAVDDGVKRTDRVTLIQPESGMAVAAARKRADWEARTRAAMAETVSIGVRGWKQPDGSLWPVNALVAVKCPAIGVAGEMLISRVDSSIDDGGEVSRLSLVRPDAFAPDNAAIVKSATGEAWKSVD